MINIKKTDLIFISKLDIKIQLIAEKNSNDNSSWILKIKTENKETNFFEEGIFTSFKGDIRKFKNINAVISLLEEVFHEKKVTLEVNI